MRQGREKLAGKVVIISLFILIMVAVSLLIAWCPMGETVDSEPLNTSDR